MIYSGIWHLIYYLKYKNIILAQLYYYLFYVKPDIFISGIRDLPLKTYSL